MEVITTHLNADFDALASMVAAKKFYPDAILAFPGSQEKAVRDFLSSPDFPVEITRLRDIDLEKIKRLILVDVKNPSRIGIFAGILGRQGLAVHIYDHHTGGEDVPIAQKKVIEDAGATSTLFTEMIKSAAMALAPAEATLLMLGIYEETGSLLFPSTTVRDISAAAYLLKKGANLNIVSRFLKRELGPDEIDLLNELVQSSTEKVIQDFRIRISKASREKYIGDIASFAHRMRETGAADAIFLIVMMENRVQVIARSYVPEIDVSEVLREIGGGGHPQAASAVVRDMSIEETEEKILNSAARLIRPTRTARDVMTRHVKCIKAASTIRKAEKMMTQYEVNVLPVVRSGRYYGLISREVVEKALFHGFGQNRVSEFCTTGVVTASPSTPVNEIESKMVERNQRFMPVIEDERVVGAITRTDLLRSLYESLIRKERISESERYSGKASIGKNLASVMKSMFPPDVLAVLKLAGEVSARLGYSAYLVGGSVRDLLRNESNLDIDIVIEGDGIAFARELGQLLKAKVKSHGRFGTAVIVTDFLKFDVATARTEYYESPAALPKVEISSIKKDLYRRDFTINTLAIMLNPGRFGRLLDFFGGQKDIRDKTIRILHNLSFIEDPTRAFRAIRFSERFGFKISKHTMNLINTAVRINLFERLSGARMFDELTLLFQETRPLNAVRRLAGFDLLRFIHPNLKLTPSLEKTITAIEEAVSWFDLLFLEEPLNKPHIFFMALLDELSPDERDSAMKRLNVPPGAGREIVQGIERASDLLLKVGHASRSEIYFMLQPLRLETILYAVAKAHDDKQKKAISLFLTDMRKTVTELSGDDLMKMGFRPGPIFKKILNELLILRLDEKLKSREDEINYVNRQYPDKSAAGTS
jgi:tRNA nucleotidyltransferase (CCA-adding enzyme)